MPKSLKEQAEAVSADYGFSSLQELIRVMVKKLSRRELNMNIVETEEIHLSPAAKKRYAKIKEDIKSGRNITSTKNLDELFKYLRK